MKIDFTKLLKNILFSFGAGLILWQFAVTQILPIDETYASDYYASTYTQVVNGKILLKNLNRFLSASYLPIMATNQLTGETHETRTNGVGEYTFHLNGGTTFKIEPGVYKSPAGFILKHAPRYTYTPQFQTTNTSGFTGQTFTLEDFTATPFENLSAGFEKNKATFNYYLTEVIYKYRIDLSTAPDMSRDVYLQFGEKNDFLGPDQIVVNNPTKWDKYQCGKTLYWRVSTTNAPGEQYVSAIQSATVNCPVEPITDSFSNLSATLASNSAQFNFSFSEASSSYRVDLSTRSDMSWDVYLDFAKGIGNTITITNPVKWDKYQCGKTLYWRIYNHNRVVKSPIQATTIICDREQSYSTPVLYPTPSYATPTYSTPVFSPASFFSKFRYYIRYYFKLR